MAAESHDILIWNMIIWRETILLNSIVLFKLLNCSDLMVFYPVCVYFPSNNIHPFPLTDWFDFPFLTEKNPFYFTASASTLYIDPHSCPFLLFSFCDHFLLPIIISLSIFFSYFQFVLLYHLLFIPPSSLICISFPTSSSFSFLQHPWHPLSTHLFLTLLWLYLFFSLCHSPFSSGSLVLFTLLSFSLYLSNLLLASHVRVTLPEAVLSKLSQRARLDWSYWNNGKFNKSQRESELG